MRGKSLFHRQALSNSSQCILVIPISQAFSNATLCKSDSNISGFFLFFTKLQSSNKSQVLTLFPLLIFPKLSEFQTLSQLFIYSNLFSSLVRWKFLRYVPFLSRDMRRYIVSLFDLYLQVFDVYEAD